MAAQGADTHAQPVDRDGLLGAEDLVGLGKALPFFLGGTAVDCLVDPREQAACQRRPELTWSKRTSTTR